MKTLQKTTLAMAIAAAPFFANADLVSLDDATMSATTGQAGVTIETSLAGQDATTIGSITYTDTNTGAAGEIGGGSLVIQGVNGGKGISVSGGTWDEASKTFTYGGSHNRQTIDIDENGNLITQTQAISDFGGSVVTSTAKEIKVGEVLLRAAGQDTGGAQLAANLTMVQQSGNSQAHILNLTGAADQATAISNYEGSAHAIGGADLTNISADAKIAIVTKSSSRIANLEVDALDGAVGVRNMSYGGGVNGDQLMESTQVIWAVNGDASTAGSKAGIYIQGSDSTGTLNIGELQLGQNNIGSIQISQISQSGNIQRIYGH